ncbi:MAG: DegT/DnrJ/EryC1/StrS family aminotransferase [Bryobacteraceae bacterium]|jgi:dTDP-4-amino-4,6-dideoxygalactose transaminase
MKVPLLDLRRQNLPMEAELLEAFRRVLGSGQFILGPEVEQFESAAAAVAGARFGVGMSSGTDAILAALMALGIGPGDEVICPSFTFFATAGCIARAGARPVFADSCPECFNLDPGGLEPLITDRTKAIIPVHLYGQAADMDPILEVARRRGLAVIEDAAQAFGAVYRGRPVGALGDIGTISFFPTKNLGAMGDAGLLVTNNEALAEKARLLRDHGASRRYFHKIVGGNFRLDAVQAALLRVKLPRLTEYTCQRQQHACEYNRALGRHQGVPSGPGAVEIVLPVTHPGRTHIVNQYTLRVRRGSSWQSGESPRDALRRFLQERGIASAIYYPVPLHAQECFRILGPHRALPVVEALADEVISLPVFPEMTPEERGAVVAAILDFSG